MQVEETLSIAGSAIQKTTDSPPFSGPAGKLAQNEGFHLPLQILHSANGFFLGTANDEGQVSRESEDYWATKSAAERALAGQEGADWTQRLEP